MVRLPGRTPVLLLDVPGDVDDTVLLYGHLDKQPEMRGWSEGLGPWTPVRRGDRLYGRGSADDGYAVFAAVTALRALREARVRHARCVVLIETCEESGSYDLPFYMEHLASRIGTPSLVVGLDSGCGDYERLWCTTSLRGIAAGALHVRVLEEGVHSGDAGGVVPSSFRIARRLLDRLEDASTGAIRPARFHAEIPAERAAQARAAAAVLGDTLYTRFPFVAGVGPTTHDGAELVLNRTWRPVLEITGADGLPALAECGQRATARHDVEALAPGPADGRRGHRHRCHGRAALRGSAVRRSRRVGAATRRRRAGMRSRRLPGSRPRWATRRAPGSGRTRSRWAKAPRSRSWRCWARASRTRSS